MKRRARRRGARRHTRREQARSRRTTIPVGATRYDTGDSVVSRYELDSVTVDATRGKLAPTSTISRGGAPLAPTQCLGLLPAREGAPDDGSLPAAKCGGILAPVPVAAGVGTQALFAGACSKPFSKRLLSNGPRKLSLHCFRFCARLAKGSCVSAHFSGSKKTRESLKDNKSLDQGNVLTMIWIAECEAR